MRKLTSLLAALALVVAIAAPAAAATTATVNESLSVNAVLELSLDTTTINYGALNKGATSDSFPVVATVNSDTNWYLAVVGSTFDRQGGGSLPADMRYNGSTPYTTGAWDASGTPGMGQTSPFSFHVVVPGNAQPGSYSGTITFTLTAQP